MVSVLSSCRTVRLSPSMIWTSGTVVTGAGNQTHAASAKPASNSNATSERKRRRQRKRVRGDGARIMVPECARGCRIGKSE